VATKLSEVGVVDCLCRLEIDLRWGRNIPNSAFRQTGLLTKCESEANQKLRKAQYKETCKGIEKTNEPGDAGSEGKARNCS
jgi:hypothetical protein